ncbi:MAG: hypothetical protein VX693_09830 [Pseudomonadota bacterium]|nr:hypothetical protein [Pseudomonadota bacterium]
MDIEFFVMSAFAGLMGTYALMMLSCWADSLGLPRLDFSRPMANLTFARSFEENVPPGAGVEAPNTPYWPGMAIVYVNGIFFALLYSSYVHQFIPIGFLENLIPIAPAVLKGAIWGVILWFVSGIFYVPIYLKEGFMLSHIHPLAWLTSLKVHVAYGLMVGWIAPTAI